MYQSFFFDVKTGLIAMSLKDRINSTQFSQDFKQCYVGQGFSLASLSPIRRNHLILFYDLQNLGLK
jgi:hypothetical protein